MRVLSYLAKIISSENLMSPLVSKVYEEMFNLTLSNPEVVTWASLVRDMLNKYGLGNYWIDQKVYNKKCFLEICRRRIQDTCLQEWDANVRDTSSARLFKIIKDNFRFEPYLDQLDKSTRVATTKIRLSSQLFNIERGRLGAIE